MGSKVRDYNIPGMPFRVHQFGTPVPSLRSSQPREDLLFASLCPSPSPPRPSPAARGSGVFGQREAGRSFPGRICYPLESVNASFSPLSFHRPFVTLLYLTCARAAPPGQLPFLREPPGQWRERRNFLFGK